MTQMRPPEESKFSSAEDNCHPVRANDGPGSSAGTKQQIRFSQRGDGIPGAGSVGEVARSWVRLQQDSM